MQEKDNFYFQYEPHL